MKNIVLIILIMRLQEFSVLTNSTPDKLINEFNKFNLKVNLKNNIWVIDE